MCYKKLKAIYSITPFTQIDYPNHLACVVWFAGCNMRCLYCYNPEIVTGKGQYTENDLLDFLKSRQGLIEGVVLSGGECTLYPNIFNLCKDIKKLGFKIKLDTNGTNPRILKKIVSYNLIDFISLDFKAPKSKFYSITKSKVDYEKFRSSLEFITKQESVNYEVRTTVHSDLLNANDLNIMQKCLIELNYKKKYYIQNFRGDKQTLGSMTNQQRILDLNSIKNKEYFEFRNF